MARTTIEIYCADVESAKQEVTKILTANNYKPIKENGENVWKCGVGFWTAMKYIKIEFIENNTVYISGWVRAMIGSEMDLDGFAAIIPKKQVSSVIDKIKYTIQY